MTQLNKGKIPKGVTCPYSDDCGSCKVTACNGNGCPVAYGKTIEHDFSCAAARGFDMIFNMEKRDE